MLKRILPNLGFILQFYGIFVIVPAYLALILNEIPCAISFFITATVSLATGFLLNIFSERISLSIRDAFVLFFLTYLVLGIIGTIPFLYLEMFGPFSLNSVINSFFESVSGFTTTGFTLIKNPEILPKSFVLYRSLTQFVGGIGIVYISLSFLYSHHPRALKRLSRVFEFKERVSEIKSIFLSILLVYSILVVISSLLVYPYFHDFFNSLVFSLSAVSTGGFTPIQEIQISSHALLLCIPMIFGAINFTLYFRWRDANDLLKRSFFMFFLLLTILFILEFTLTRNFEHSVFYTVSALTTSGFKIHHTFSEPEKFFLSLFMLIGGMTVSTAGGIKVERVLSIIDQIPKMFKEKFWGVEERVDTYPLLLFLMFLITFLFSVSFFTLSNYDLSDSFLISASALSTSGIAPSNLVFSLSSEQKLFLSFIMILGRVEIIPFLLVFVKPKISNKI